MEWTFDPVGGKGTALLIAALLLALPWIAPPQGVGITPRRRRVLVALRVAATLALLFAWARPTLLRVAVETIRPTLLVLVDASRSMTTGDALDGATRWEAVKRMLGASGKQLERLQQKQDLSVYRFDRTLERLEVDDGTIDLPAQPDGDETALGAALAEAVEAIDARLGGVILMSDGAQRAAPPRDTAPQSVAQRLAAEGAPLFAVPVGQRAGADRLDLAIEDLIASDAAFAGAPLEATASLRVSGLPSGEARVRLLWENARGELDAVDAARVAIRQGIDAYPIALRHTPTEPGEWKLVIEADTLEGETLTGNNRASTFVTVREGGLNVLILSGANRVGGAPGLEQRFVRASLAASPDLSVRRRRFDYRQRRQRLAEELGSEPIDVLLVDNLDAEALDRASLQAIARRVEQGAGLAMIGGRQSFGAGGHASTPLGELLPVSLGRAERQPLDAPLRDDVHLPGPLRVVPAEPFGVSHPVMRLSDKNLAAWAELPPLDGANRLDPERLKPGAMVLAQSDGPDPRPLVVAGQYGLGRVLALAGDSTWRWPLAGQGESHRRFWRQAVLWLAKKDQQQDKPVYLELASRRVPKGARLDLIAGVRADADDANPDPVRYQATVTLPDGGAAVLPLPGSATRVAGSFTGTNTPGDYRVTVEARRGDHTLGRAEGRFLVPDLDLELERPGAEPDTLARLAQATSDHGGRVVALEELPELFRELADRPLDQKQEVASRTTLWDTWPTLLLFVGLLTAEWLVRRRWGMP